MIITGNKEMINYINKRIIHLEKKLKKINDAHRQVALTLGIEPLDNDGWDDTLELEGRLKELDNMKVVMGAIYGEQ